MAKIIIEVPNQYIPGIEAARHVLNASGSFFATNEEFSSHVAVEAAKSWCQQYKVGAYWENPQPQFNANGTPYDSVVEEVITANGEEIIVDNVEEVVTEENALTEENIDVGE